MPWVGNTFFEGTEINGRYIHPQWGPKYAKMVRRYKKKNMRRRRVTRKKSFRRVPASRTGRYLTRPRAVGTGTAFVKISLNPFAATASAAKIPDGKALVSSSQRFQTRSELQIGASGQMDVILFPGLNNCVTIFGGVNNAAAAENINMAFGNHGFFQQTGNPATLTQPNATKIERWRTVCAGLSLKVVNASDDNNGWFEAVRFTRASNDRFPFINAGGTGNVFPGTVNAAQFTQIFTAGSNLVENPTYSTGTIRELNATLFRLMPQMESREFQSVGTEAVGTSPLVDGSFDLIFIRIHGRVDQTNPTRLLAHV